MLLEVSVKSQCPNSFSFFLSTGMKLCFKLWLRAGAKKYLLCALFTRMKSIVILVLLLLVKISCWFWWNFIKTAEFQFKFSDLLFCIGVCIILELHLQLTACLVVWMMLFFVNAVVTASLLYLVMTTNCCWRLLVPCFELTFKCAEIASLAFVFIVYRCITNSAIIISTSDCFYFETQTDGGRHRQTDGRTDAQTHRHIQTHRFTDRRTYRQAEIQADRQTDTKGR